MAQASSRPWWIAGLVLVCAGAAITAWRLQPVTVPAWVVQAAPLQRSLQFSARISSRARVELGATVTGRVASVTAQVGDRVKAGDVLLTLEADDAQAALAQALATAQQADARLVGLQQSGRRVADSNVAQAQATLANAQAERVRTDALVAQGFLSEARRDDSQKATALAQAQLASAQALQAALGAGPASGSADHGRPLLATDVQQAQAQRSAALAGVAAARARLAQTVIQAPTEALVLERLAEPGQIVQPGRALLSLALHTPLELVAQVDERYLEQLAPGQSAQAMADAFAGQRLAATVSRIAPVVDAERGAVEVRLRLTEAPPAHLREDMSFSVAVDTGRRAAALSLPLAALVTGPDHRLQAWVLSDGQARLRTVQTGLRTLQAVEVTAGLKAGDIVLLPTGTPLRDGQRVRADTEAGERWMQPGGRADEAGVALMNSLGR